MSQIGAGESRSDQGTGPRLTVPLAILGGGNMAQAIVRGGVLARLLDTKRVGVAEIDGAKRRALNGLGVHVFDTAGGAVDWMLGTETRPGEGQLLVAVKPQSLAGLAPEIRGAMGAARRVVITILAGTPTTRVRDLLGQQTGIVRAMPNLAAQVGRGATAICLGDGAAVGDEVVAMRLFAGVGRLVMTIDESLMDAFTAVAGSGPAYVFYLAEAMARAAREVGLDEKTAMAVVAETIAGAGELLARSARVPADMRAAVTSKGGTTAAAIDVLDKSGVMQVVVRAIVAARDRGREIAGGGPGRAGQ
jgi:pyrroline-5-carboxylate reductase